MLEITNLSAGYGKIKAVNQVSLKVDDGEFVTLIGANGAGKSTTLKSIVGLIKDRSGTINFNGRDISKVTPYQALDLGIALVPEGRWIFPELSVEENLGMGGFKRKRQEISSLMQEQYEYFPILHERSKQRAGTLSGGEQQMLAIARALMSRPKLLLLDEPSLGLAPILVQEVFKLIQRIGQAGISILLVEQNSTMALSVAERGYVLESSRIVLQGTSSELLNNKRVQSAYLGIA